MTLTPDEKASIIEQVNNKINESKPSRHEKNSTQLLGVVKNRKHSKERIALIESIRKRSKAYGLEQIISHALLNHNAEDPLLSLHDNELNALDISIDEGVFCRKNGIMLEDAKIVPNRLFVFDVNEPLDAELLELSKSIKEKVGSQGAARNIRSKNLLKLRKN